MSFLYTESVVVFSRASEYSPTRFLASKRKCSMKKHMESHTSAPARQHVYPYGGCHKVYGRSNDLKGYMRAKHAAAECSQEDKTLFSTSPENDLVALFSA